ncbi:uncharacterized protein METZ01_LOCUS65988, partial [marine metagenome]
MLKRFFGFLDQSFYLRINQRVGTDSLQRADLQEPWLGHSPHRLVDGLDLHVGTSHRRNEWDVEFDCQPAHHVPVEHRSSRRAGGVDDEVDLALAHQVQRVGRAALCDPVAGLDVEPPHVAQHVGGAPGGVEGEAHVLQPAGLVDDGQLVAVLDGDVDASLDGYRQLGGEPRLQVGRGRPRVRAHHLAGGLHLGTWGGVEASQLDER